MNGSYLDPILQEFELYRRPTMEDIMYMDPGKPNLRVDFLSTKEDIDAWYTDTMAGMAMVVAVVAKTADRSEFGRSIQVLECKKRLGQMGTIKRALYRGIGEKSEPELSTIEEFLTACVYVCGQHEYIDEEFREEALDFLRADEELGRHFEKLKR